MAEVAELLNDEKYNIPFEVKTYDNPLANRYYRDNAAFDLKNSNSNPIEHAQNIGLAVTKAVTESHNSVKNNKSGISDNQIVLQKDCFSLASDYHGDSVSFVGQLALAGAIIIDPNKVVYYNLDKDEIYDNKEKIAEIKLKHDNGELIHDNYDLTLGEDISEKDRIVAIPYMKLNQNFKGEIICLGDYGDRGPESQHILATINYLSHLQKINPIPGKVTFLLGNHDVPGFEGSPSALSSYSNIMQRMVKDGIFQTCVTREITKIDADGHEFKEPLIFSHAALTKNDLPAMFLFASRLLGKDRNFNEELNENPEAKAAFEEAQTFFMNELNKEENADLKTLFNSLDENDWQEINNYSQDDYWSSIGIELYDKLISKGFTEKQIFQLKNLIGNASYGLFGKIYSQENDMIDTPGAKGLGWIYGNRHNPNENEKFETTQQIGHTAQNNVLETSNIAYEDVARSVGYNKNFSLIFNDYLDQQGNRYQQAYSVARNNKGEIFPDKIKQNEIKLGVRTSEGLIQNKKGNKKRFQSKKRMLNIFTDPSIETTIEQPNIDPKLLDQINELFEDKDCQLILSDKTISDLSNKIENNISNEELNNEIKNILDNVEKSYINILNKIDIQFSPKMEQIITFIKENPKLSLKEKVTSINRYLGQLLIPNELTKRIFESDINPNLKLQYYQNISLLSKNILSIPRLSSFTTHIYKRTHQTTTQTKVNPLLKTKIYKKAKITKPLTEREQTIKKNLKKKFISKTIPIEY